MNFTITTKLPANRGKRPIHLWTMNQLLGQLGVGKIKTHDSGRVIIPHAKARDERFLWDRYEEAKLCHRRLIARHHPDRGGCTKHAAEINSIWGTLKERFASRGISVAALLLVILTGCGTTPPEAIMPPMTAAKAPVVRTLLSAPQVMQGTATLSAANNPGAVDIYSSADLANWEYEGTLPETNSVMSVDAGQSQAFYRGQVSGISMNVLWHASGDTNVAGYLIYTGPASGQYTESYNVGLVTNAQIFIGSSNVAPVIYLTATSYNAAGWQSSYAPEISLTPTVPVLNLQP